MAALITDAQISIFYPQFDVATMDVVRANSICAGKYLPFNLIRENDNNIVAMALSENGNSQIFISKYSAALVVKYTPDWQRDSKQAQDYLLERIPLITKLIEKSLGTKALYSGSSVESIIPVEGDDSIATGAIASWVGASSKPGEQVSDIGFSKSIVEDQARYLNINVTNYRDFSYAVPPSPQLRMNNAAAMSRGVKVSVDYNDRFAYNSGKDAVFSDDFIGEIVAGAFSHAQTITQNIDSRLKMGGV